VLGLLGLMGAAQNAREAQRRVDEYKRDELVKYVPSLPPFVWGQWDNVAILVETLPRGSFRSTQQQPPGCTGAAMSRSRRRPLPQSVCAEREVVITPSGIQR